MLFLIFIKQDFTQDCQHYDGDNVHSTADIYDEPSWADFTPHHFVAASMAENAQAAIETAAKKYGYKNHILEAVKLEDLSWLVG